MYAAAMPVAAKAIAPIARLARVQPTGYPDERAGQHRARADPDLRPQDSGLRGEHQQQHHTDERDRDTGDGQGLADPARVTRWPCRLRLGARWWRRGRHRSGVRILRWPVRRWNWLRNRG